MSVGRMLLIWFIIAAIVIIGLLASGILTIRVKIIKKGRDEPDFDDDDDDDDGDDELWF